MSDLNKTSEDVSAEDMPAKRRGRPRKRVQETAAAEVSAKKRGRPKKNASAQMQKAERHDRPSELVFALDIGTRSVIGIVAEQRDGMLHILATERMEHKTRAMLDGQIHDVPQVAAVIREVGVDTGGCNIQFAVDPATGRIIVIEMNPRVSRSSALASKATGFPIAKIAARLAVGYTLDEIPNDITASTPASFEPTLDYVVVKVPRFAFEKFRGADPRLTTTMKSVGEAMAIGRSYTEALQKAMRSLDKKGTVFHWDGPAPTAQQTSELLESIATPSEHRLVALRLPPPGHRRLRLQPGLHRAVRLPVLRAGGRLLARGVLHGGLRRRRPPPLPAPGRRRPRIAVVLDHLHAAIGCSPARRPPIRPSPIRPAAPSRPNDRKDHPPWL